MALYHRKKGSVNYTIVGSPTIVDGVASGFSDSSYLSLGNTFKLSATTVAEFVFKINVDTLGTINGICGTPGNHGLHFIVASSNKLAIYLGDNSNWSIISNAQGTTVLQANTDYYVKLSINNQVVSMYLSTDGITYTQEMSQTVTVSAEYTYNLAIGRVRTTNQYFRGSIDLNKSYITYNGAAWFGICPIEVQKHQLMGPVGYEELGTPTITNGVLVNPTDKQNTIKTTQAINVGDGPWEMQFKLLNPTRKGSFLFRINGSNNTRFTLTSSNGLNGYLNNPQDSSSVVRPTSLANIWNNAIDNSASAFYWRVACSGKDANNQYPVKVYCSLDGQNWTADTDNIVSTVPLASGVLQISSYSSYATGTVAGYDIDLNETWIKVGGKLWFWQPQATKKIYVNNSLVWEKSS